jgi:HEAT repeat protein
MAGPKVRDDVLTLGKALRHRDRFIRRHAAATLIGLGTEAAAATEELGRAVTDKDSEIASRATRALGRIGPEAVPHLCTALTHCSALVRREAVWGLKEFGPAGLPALPALVQALRDDDLRVRLGAAQALGAIGPDAVEAVPHLAEALKDTNLIHCRLAAQALARVGTASLPTLRQLLNQSDPHIRREAAWAVRQIQLTSRDPQAHPAIGDPAPREAAATQVVDCMPDAQARTALIS